MLHLDWESPANEKSLRKIVERKRLLGGNVVTFQRVVSFIIFTKRSTRFCLVSRYENRVWRGLIVSAPTLVLGWWSPAGFVHSCYALAHNLLGGLDVTGALENPSAPQNREQVRSFARRRFGLFLAIALGIVLPLLARLYFWYVGR